MKRLTELALFPAIALACALAANALAGPERRLAWIGRPLEAPAPMAPTPTPALLPTPPPVAAPSPQPAPPSSIQSASPPPSPSPRPAPPAPVASTASPFQEIGSEEAWQAHQSGARFLDARRAAEYRGGHIAGAWSTPVWESDLEARLTAFEASSGASYSDTLVLYCGGGDCQDSHLLAGRLMALGYRTLRIYREGFPDWMAKGRPVRTGGER